MNKQSATVPDKVKYTKLSHRDVVTVGKFIESVCTTDAEGFAVYKDGWSDRKVYEHLSKQISSVPLTAIEGLRRSLFGNFRRNVNVPSPEVVDAISKLEKLVEQEIAKSESLMKRISRMEAWLSKSFPQDFKMLLNDNSKPQTPVGNPPKASTK